MIVHQMYVEQTNANTNSSKKKKKKEEEEEESMGYDGDKTDNWTEKQIQVWHFVTC